MTNTPFFGRSRAGDAVNGSQKRDALSLGLVSSVHARAVMTPCRSASDFGRFACDGLLTKADSNKQFVIIPSEMHSEISK